MRLEMTGKLKAKCFGRSMVPILQPGQVFQIEKPVGPIQKYDLIVFPRDGVMVCHYVAHINRIPDGDGQTVYITHGYRNRAEDIFPVRAGDILGVARDIRLTFWQKLMCRIRSLRARAR